MRRVGFVLGALVILVGALVPALAQQPFADVPLDHWAYNAVNTLAETGLIEGYPDGTFKGKHALTRYEFAQAVARMMDRIEAMAKEPGPEGPPGPPGPAGAGGGLTAEQQAMLDRLAKEFAPELKALRSDLDNLTKRVEELEARPAPEMPAITVSGDINIRGGAYGTALGVEDVSTTGYPFFEELQDYYYYDGIGASNFGGGLFLGAVAPYGGINLPMYDSGYGLWTDDPTYVGGPIFMASLPISDALKDSYKASDFLTMRTRVIFSGQLAENAGVNVTVLADPRSNNPRDPYMDLAVGSPNWLTGNGVMDTVKVDEAWVKYSTELLTPVDIVAGKQYVSRGVGLLADNSQEAVKGLRMDWSTNGPVSWGAYWGMLDREQFWGRSTGSVGLPDLDPALAGALEMYTNGQDNYNLYYLNWQPSDNWGVGLNWLDSGFNLEQGWSASLCGKFFGLQLYGEYAQLRQWPTGLDYFDANANATQDANELELSESDNAWMAGLKWDGDWIALTGEYGEVDPGYAYAVPGAGWSAVPPFISSDYFTFNLPLSALHPLAEVNPHYINWIDRPLFLDPTNIARGWHVNVTFPKLLGEKTPVSVSYASGDAYNPRYLSWLLYGGAGSGIVEPDQWTDADPIWVVQVCRQLSDTVTAKLLYGRREVDNVMSPQVVPIVPASAAADQVAHYAENEPIQVIRGELSIEF